MPSKKERTIPLGDRERRGNHSLYGVEVVTVLTGVKSASLKTVKVRVFSPFSS